MGLNKELCAFSVIYLLFSVTIILCQHTKQQQLQSLYAVETNGESSKEHGYDASFMSSEGRSGVGKVVSFPFRGLMYVYQNIVSGQLYGHCMYKTTCSNFSKQCIHRYGFVKGVFLSADRLSRCTGLCFHDYSGYKIHHHRYIIDDPKFYSFH